MKTILVATDFSTASLNASNYAADMAMAINADIALLHVFQVPVSYSEAPVIMNMDDMQRIAEKDISDLRDVLLARSKDKINITTIVRMGNFFDELKSTCESIHPYSVLMGSQGKTGAERLLFGGHTVHAMQNLAWPLITVPPDVKFSAIKKIGLACDFNKVVDTTPVTELKILLTDFQAELHVLNTGRKEDYDPEIVFQSGMLQELLVSMKPTYHFISSKDIDEGILNFAEVNHIDLLIVLPKRHGLFDQLIHKSHTKQLVLHSHVPVMALHHE